MENYGWDIINKFMLDTPDSSRRDFILKNKEFFSKEAFLYLEDLVQSRTNIESIKYMQSVIDYISSTLKQLELEELIETRTHLFYPRDLQQLIENANLIVQLLYRNYDLRDFFLFQKSFYGEKLRNIIIEYCSDLTEEAGYDYNEKLEVSLNLAEYMHMHKDKLDQEILFQVLRVLTKIYRLRLLGDKYENLKAAEQVALKAMDLAFTDDENISHCYNALSVIYSAYAEEGINREFNIKKSIDSALKALSYKKVEDDSFTGLVNMNLNHSFNSLAVFNFKQGDHKACKLALEEAREFGKKATFLLKKADNVLYLGSAEATLAQTYQAYYNLLEQDYHDEIISHTESALKYENRPYLWAKLVSLLGRAYYFKRENDYRYYTEKGLHYIEQSLKVLSYEKTPQEWAYTQNFIGDANLFLFKRTKEKEYFEKAIFAYQQALLVFTENSYPDSFYPIAHELAKAFYYNGKDLNDLEQSYFYSKKAHAAIENIRIQSPSISSKRSFAIEIDDCYKLLIATCIALNKLEEAFIFSSVSKSRTFSDAIGSEAMTMEKLSRKDNRVKLKYNKIKELRAELNNLEALNNTSITENISFSIQDSNTERNEKINSIRKELIKTIESIQLEFPELLFSTSSQIISFEDAIEFCNSKIQGAVIEYCYHYAGWSVFVFNKGKFSHISLSNVNVLLEKLNKLLKETAEASISLKYMPNDEFEGMLKEFHEKLIKPILPHVEDSTQWFISATKDLQQIPFTLALDSMTNRFIIEDTIISNIPSLANLITFQKHFDEGLLSNELHKSMFFVSPSIDDSHSPSTSFGESISIINSFDGENVLLAGKSATPENVIKVLDDRNFSVVHFSCHGSFHFEQPEFSGLFLYEGRMLTVEQLQTEIKLNRFPFISIGSCQSGINKIQGGDEATGLTTTFLSLGAGAVLSSLWSIEDDSTRAFYEEFYAQYNIEEANYSKAFQKAVLKVKNDTSNWAWDHPYYWGSFHIIAIPFLY